MKEQINDAQRHATGIIRNYLFVGALVAGLSSCHVSNKLVISVFNNTQTQIGTITLMEEGNRTLYRVNLINAYKNSDYIFNLNSESGGNTSASMTMVAKLTTDGDGKASARGYVKYHGDDDIRFADVARRENVILVSTHNEEYLLKIVE